MSATRPAPCPPDDGTARAALRLYYWWEARLFRLERERARLTRQGGRSRPGPLGLPTKEVRDVDGEARKGLTQLEVWRWLHATRGREATG